MDDTTQMTDAETPDDATAELPPPAFSDPPPPPEKKRIRRGRDQRVAGVCDGLARHFDVDPLYVRIAFVIGAVLAFPLVFAYLVLWVVLPGPDGSPSVGDKDRSFIGVAAIAIGVIVLAATIGDDIAFQVGGGLLIPVALLAFGLWLLLETPGDRAEGSDDRRINIPRYPAAAAGAPATSFDAPPPGGPRVDPVTGAPLPPLPAAGPPAPPEPRSPITPLVLSALAIGFGAVALLNQVAGVDVTVTQAIAGGVIIVGIGMVASAFFGRARGLGFLGVVLVLALGVSATVEPAISGGIGERTTIVEELSGSSSSYEFGIGEYLVDFRRVDLLDDHTATIDFGIGEGRVVVPSDVNVVVEANLEVGELNALGEYSAGVGNEEIGRRIVDEGGPTLTIEVDQLIGELQICHGTVPPVEAVVIDGQLTPPPVPGIHGWVCGR